VIDLEDQIRECYGRVVYSHKTHEKMAEICAREFTCYQWGQIIVSGLITSGLIGIVLSKEYSDKIIIGSITIGYILSILLGLISLVNLCLSGYVKGFDPGGVAQKHRETAAKLWGIRETYLSLLTDLKNGTITEIEARSLRDDVQKKLSEIYQSAPQTNEKAYKKAQIALQKNQELTFSDSELDNFLPLSLRKT